LAANNRTKNKADIGAEKALVPPVRKLQVEGFQSLVGTEVNKQCSATLISLERQGADWAVGKTFKKTRQHSNWCAVQWAWTHPRP
jgi:hypothetical protein